MKRIIAFIIMAVMCFFVISCGKKSDIPDGMQLASGEDVAYRLFVPGGWNLTLDDNVNGAYYSQSDKSSITMTSYYPETNIASVDDYWKACSASYKNVYDNFEAQEEASPLVFGGKNAFKYVFTATIDGTDCKFMQIITVHKNLFYILTYTSTAEKYDLHIEDVNSVISNFIFR